jgi:hypothetical protein
VSAGLTLASGGAALAVPYYQEPTIELGSSTVAQGGALALTLDGFLPGEIIQLDLNVAGHQPTGGDYRYVTILPDWVAGTDGRVTGSLTLPGESPVGDASLFAWGSSSYRYTSATFTVTGDISTAPSFSFDPAVAAPGDEVSFTASGFHPNTYFDMSAPGWGDLGLGELKTNASGGATGKITVPEDASGVRTRVDLDTNGPLSNFYATTIIAVIGDYYVAEVTVGSATAVQGGAVALTLSGFLPGEQVEIGVFSEYQKLTVLAADDSGNVQGTATLPSDLSPGNHTIRALGLTSGRVAETSINVTAKPGGGVPGDAKPGGGTSGDKKPGSGLPSAANDAPVG